MLPENVIVGFTQGVVDGYDDGALPPWSYVKALGYGFTEIPSGIEENANWTDFIKERADPDSFWYRHNMSIGLGMSVLTDPTMYLSFGTTGASKLAAKGLWVLEARESAGEALKYMASGKIHPLTGLRYSAKDDFNTVFAEIHMAHERPFTLGDALVQLRKTDRAEGGAYRKVFPRGGQGTRFAGMEVPGTKSLGQSMARFFRDTSDDALSNRGTTDFFARAFVPDAAMHAIGHDLIRTTAMLENNAIRRETAAIGEKISKNAANVALLDNPIARTVGGIFGGPTKYVSIAKRAGVLRDTQGVKDPIIKQLINRAHGQKGNVIKRAVAQGLDEKQIKELNGLWDRLVRDIDDPVQVTAQFVSRSMARLLAHDQIEKVLANPVLARRIEEAPFLDPAASTALARQTGTMGRIVRSTEDFGKMEMLGQVINQGTRPFRWKGKDYAVVDAVGDALDNLKNPGFIDAEMSRFFRGINGAQNLWKLPATVLNPAFHVMNVVGGMWNNMLAGPYGPFDHLEAWARIAQKRIAEEQSKGWVTRPVLGTLKKTALIRRQGALKRDIMGEFERRGAGGRSSFFSNELTTGNARDIVQQVGDRPFMPKLTRSGLRVRVADTGRVFTAARRTTAGLGAAQIGADVAAYNGWIEDFNIPGGNELWGVVGFAPELTKLGKFTASYSEEILRLTPFQETWKDKTIRRIAEAAGPIQPPNFAKMAPKGLTKRQESAVFDIGTEMSIRYQFDYSHLTTIERNFAKTIFPFWTFYKNNFVLQSKEILNRPRFVQGFYHMANYIQDEWGDDLPPEMQQMLPEYFSNLGAFQIPVPVWARDKMGLPQDTPLYLNPKLPFISLNLFPPFWELWNDKSVTPFWQRALQVVSPVTGSVGPFAAAPVPGAKLMFEAITGTNLGLARPLDYQRASSNDWRNSFTPAPGYLRYLPEAIAKYLGAVKDPVTGQLIMPTTHKYIMDNLSTPFISNYGKVVPTGATGARGDKARADLVAWMTGIRLMPVDTLKITRSWSYRVRSQLEARQSELRDQGLELDEDDDMTLRRIRAQIKNVEVLWDQREQELYGNAP